MELLGLVVKCIGCLIAALVAAAVALLLALLVSRFRVCGAGRLRHLRPHDGTVRFETLWGAVAVTGVAGARPAWQFRLFGRPVRWGRRREAGRQPTVAPVQAGRRPPSRPATPREAPEQERRGPRGGGRALWHEMRGRGLIQQWISPVAHALRELLRAPRCELLRANVRFGTGDPAVTGMLCGTLSALTGPLWGLPALSIRLEPDFLDSGVEGEGEFAVSVRPGAVVSAAARLLWRGPTWRTVKAYRAVKRRRRVAPTGNRAAAPPKKG